MECYKPFSLSKLRKIGVVLPVMVSKLTVKDKKYTNILMGTVQAAIAHGVLDSFRAGGGHRGLWGHRWGHRAGQTGVVAHPGAG
jgi:Formaldehyde-activating enzyme (Fae)